MNTDDRDLAGAWALDALSPKERDDFERYLAGSIDARVEAIELTDTAAELGRAVSEVAPPADLRARILDLTMALPQVAAEPRTEAANPTSDAAHSAAHAPALRRRRRLTPRSVFALAASVLLLSGLVAGGVGIQAALTPTSESQAIARVQDASDARTARASFTTGTGSAVLTWSESRAQAVLAVQDAASAPSQRVYQLWYLKGADARPAGTFTVNGSGDATVALKGTMHSGDAVGVTIEPMGGSQHPTTPTVVVVPSA